MLRGLIIILLSLAVLPVWGKSYTLRRGLLPAVMREIEQLKDEKVTFIGEMDSEELRALRHLPRCVTALDLSQLRIAGEESDSASIPPFALFATNIRSLILPPTLTAIGEGAFAETSLVSLAIPEDVKSVGPRAFYNCKELKGVNMSECKVSELAEECFSGCTALEELWLPSSLAAVGDRALMRTAIKSLVIPAVGKIGCYALAEMPELSSITLRAAAEIGEGALFNTPKLVAADRLTLKSPALGFAMSGRIADGSLIDDAIVGEGAFAGAYLTTIRIGKSVENISPHAFRNVKGLAQVDVTAKGDDAPILSEEAFSGVDTSKVRLMVSDGSEEIWRNAPVWKEFMIESSAGVSDVTVDASKIEIEGNKGMVRISSDTPMEYVGIYSLGGMTLFERHDCSGPLTAGPFADKEILVRVLSGNVVKAAALQIN